MYQLNSQQIQKFILTDFSLFYFYFYLFLLEMSKPHSFLELLNGFLFKTNNCNIYCEKLYINLQLTCGITPATTNNFAKNNLFKYYFTYQGNNSVSKE